MAETETYVSYFVYFSDLKTIYSYFITIILITMNNQHSYKHLIPKILLRGTHTNLVALITRQQINRARDIILKLK